MFDCLKKKKAPILIGSPVKGRVVSVKEVSDPTFGEELLGKGVAVYPEEGNIYAPADGVIELLFGTKHAVTIKTKDGMELLVHVGLDTVTLNGKHFMSYKKTGDAVSKGDLILTVELEAAKEEGYDMIVPMVICNTENYETVEEVTGMEVLPGDTVLRVTAT